MLQMLIAGSPERQAWVMRLGQRLFKDGYHRAAEWTLGQVASYGTPSATLYYDLGQSQAERGRLTEARDSLRQGLALNPNFYLCRRFLNDLCRRQYWEEGAPLPEGAALTPSQSLLTAHEHVRQAALKELLLELVRTDDDTLGEGVVARLLSRLELGEEDKARRALREAVITSGQILERARGELAEAASPGDAARIATVTLRDGERLRLIGARDADDLIGFHLEAILEDRLTWLPFAAMAKVGFGARSDYIRAEIYTLDGTCLEVAVPLSYYGSHRSRLEDVRSGEMTILQPLVDGLNAGLGRRSYLGMDEATGELRAVAVPEIHRIDFDDDAA